MTEHVRLSVNLSPATAQAFRALVDRKGIRITEGVQRAIAVWRFVEDETAAGNRLAIVNPDGTVHDVKLMDGEQSRPPEADRAAMDRWRAAVAGLGRPRRWRRP